MKLDHKPNRRVLSVISLLISLQLFSGCSWFKGAIAIDDEPQTVPKQQFDQLLSQYERLKKSQSMQAATANAKREMGDLNAIEADSDAIVKQLNRVNTPLSGTVDVASKPSTRSRPVINLKRGAKNSAVATTPRLSSSEYSAPLVESHIKKIREAESLVVQNKFPAALKIIKELSSSASYP